MCHFCHSSNFEVMNHADGDTEFTERASAVISKVEWLLGLDLSVATLNMWQALPTSFHRLQQWISCLLSRGHRIFVGLVRGHMDHFEALLEG